VWHEFVLFTAEYTRFCETHFGKYMHHDPANAPREHVARATGVHTATLSPADATYDEFRAIYEAFFGTTLPAAWHDDLYVGLDVRLRNDHVVSSSVCIRDGRAELLRDEILVLARVDPWAEEALRFIACHASFYPRELPGRLRAEDRVALCRALVRSRALRVAQ
jgi:hypothetical protein